MSNAVVGALRVVLGLDTAAFSDGLRSATNSLQAVGDRMQSIGQTLTTRVTAPLVAAAGAVGIGVGKMASNLQQLGNQAAIAGVAVEEFQKLAFAARTVGIEQDKLSDILKDVNDKVGDFLATGGGEMADFFENIAPQVGVTADMFRGLSGPDALQLFVSSLEKANVSSAEMTFYLEAIANDATALIPLLANNGAEMARLGAEAERFGLVSAENVQSGREFQAAMQGLTASLSLLGRAFVDTGVLDALTTIVTRLADIVRAVNTANPRLTQIVLVVGGLAAALGPVLVGLGLLATGIAAIGVPAAAVAAGIAAMSAALVAFWPEVMATKDAVIAFGTDALDWIKAKPQEIADAFRGLAADMYQIGVDVIQGLLDGLREGYERVTGAITGIATGIVDRARDALGIQSPSTVFAEIGENIMLGLASGIGSMTGDVNTQVQSFAQQLAGTFADVLTGARDWRDALSGILSSVGQSLIGAGIGGLGGALGIPGFANGTSFAPGGLALVGERGPEIVNLPRGSRVTPNDALGGVTINQNNTFAAGVDANAIRPLLERNKRETMAALVAANRERKLFP